ncbi:hypothetical protein [Streptomyces sp. H39-S7]|uniref:hypothetical protein n=1 Tax=Streptomyces sp. H39-S7 TaxID=3004357 RepID=UPI0022AF1F02|nr:hypothetical protein [Streptomyces sp. H39-S7]MCZ4120225.1 hypothetical protein [Streptomyces sp. H39-S7]
MSNETSLKQRFAAAVTQIDWVLEALRGEEDSSAWIAQFADLRRLSDGQAEAPDEYLQEVRDRVARMFVGGRNLGDFFLWDEDFDLRESKNKEWNRVLQRLRNA